MQYKNLRKKNLKETLRHSPEQKILRMLKHAWIKLFQNLAVPTPYIPDNILKDPKKIYIILLRNIDLNLIDNDYDAPLRS